MVVYFDAMMTRQHLVQQSPPSLSSSAVAKEAVPPGGAPYAKPCAFTTVELKLLYHVTQFVHTPNYGIVVRLRSPKTYLGTHFNSTTSYAIAAFDFGKMKIAEDEPQKAVLRTPVYVTLCYRHQTSL